MVLKGAGIIDPKDVVSALGLSHDWLLQARCAPQIGLLSVWKEILNKWKEQESYVSWNKLAEAVREKFGVDFSQFILNISGEGEVIQCFKTREQNYIKCVVKLH